MNPWSLIFRKSSLDQQQNRPNRRNEKKWENEIGGFEQSAYLMFGLFLAATIYLVRVSQEMNVAEALYFLTVVRRQALHQIFLFAEAAPFLVSLSL